MTARTMLRDRAMEQDGLITAMDARALGLNPVALRVLAHRGALEHEATGVYRFTDFPYVDRLPYREAVLWTGRPDACLSHETVLDVLDLCDVNPGVIHVTIPRGERLRRRDPRFHAHAEDLHPDEVQWWNEIPAVGAATAIRQSIAMGTPGYLVRQAITRARKRRLISPEQSATLTRRVNRREAQE